MPTDAQLIHRARQDPDAFAELYVRHARAVDRFLRARIPAGVAGELTAETFAQAAQPSELGRGCACAAGAERARRRLGALVRVLGSQDDRRLLALPGARGDGETVGWVSQVGVRHAWLEPKPAFTVWSKPLR